MYILTLEYEDTPYPSKSSYDLSNIEEVIEYIRVAYDQGYKIVSLTNDSCFYGKVENENGVDTSL